MASDEFQLRVDGLPSGLNEIFLKCFFLNTKKSGGGKVKDVALSNGFAIITFVEKEAVDIVLNKGDTVQVKGKVCKVSRVCNEKRDKQPVTPPRTSLKGNEALQPIQAASMNRATVEIVINDVRDAHRDVFAVLFETEKIDEEKIFMDGLKKRVYVTFHSAEDAEKACEMDFTEDLNVKSVCMASDEAFDNYVNLISIHGMDFSTKGMQAKLKKYVLDKTESSPDRILMGEEPFSAILAFDRVTDIYPIAWKCVSELDGTKLFTGPVKISKSVFVTTDGHIDELTVKRYFSTSAKSNGGPVQKCCALNEGFVVTFEDSKHAQSVSAKTNHTFAHVKMSVKLWHPCLSKEAYATFLQLPGSNESPSQSSQRRKAHVNRGASDNFEIIHSSSVHCFALLEKSGFVNGLMDDSHGVTIEIDQGSHSVKIQGDRKSAQSIENKIKEKELDFEKHKLEEFDGKRLDFMLKQKTKIQDEINDISFIKKTIAYIEIENKNIWCHFDKKLTNSDDIKKIIEVINTELTVHVEDFSGQVQALLSEEGKSFISKLLKNTEKPCQIDMDPESGKIEIITIGKQFTTLWYEINRFLKNHKIESKTLTFPDIKFQYVKKYLQKEFDSIVDCLKGNGAKVKVEEGKIHVTGLQSGIAKAEQDLSSLREKMTIQDENIHFFGIMEFFASNHGKKMLEDEGHKNSCILLPMDFSFSDGVAPTTSQDRGASSGGVVPSASQHRGTLVGSCDVGKIKVKFILGDITALNVNVIISGISKKLQSKSGQSKAIVQIGGDQIQEELNGYTGSRDPGSVVITKGGKLQCSDVFHLILEKGLEGKDLRQYVTDCLKTADQGNHKSVAMPLIGCGKFRMPELGACLNISKSVQEFAEKASNITEIIICDNSVSHIKAIISRFDNVDQISSLESDDGSEDEDSSPRSHNSKKERGTSYSPEKKRFGPVTLTIKSGNIMKENCDVMACGLRENMKLSSGGAVSKLLQKACGAPLETECSQKEDDMKNDGAVETSSNGLTNCSALIFANMNKFSRSWDKGVEKVLSLAEENGHRSIALPAFGTGAKHANVPKLKSMILDAIKKFGEKSRPKTLKDVRLVIYDKNILKTFMEDRRDSKHRKNKDSKPVPNISKSATIRVVHQNVANARKAIKDLKDACEKAFTDRSSHIPAIMEWSEDQIKELTNEGLRQQVQVTVKKETGDVILASFSQAAITKMVEEMWKAVNIAKEEKHQQDFRAVKFAFKWQFMSQGRWRDFDQLLNFEIEKAFTDAESSVEIEDPNHRKYVIDFQSMKEFRIKGDQREELTTVNRYDLEAESGGHAFPTEWDKMDGKDQNFKVVPLSTTSKEYQDVEAYFKKCGAAVAIKKIERIQNVVLYQQYAAKKIYFEKNNPKGTENEKRLFHGTDPAAIASINISGFNRSFCGKNATVHGNGVYFAEQSSYSVNYARADAQGDKKMYLARVLVGVTTQSTSGMNYLPYKPGTNEPYDSGRGPNMYIIYHDCQAYPEYLITF